MQASFIAYEIIIKIQLEEKKNDPAGQPGEIRVRTRGKRGPKFCIPLIKIIKQV